MLLVTQSDKSQETEKRLKEMAAELEDYQTKYKKSLECSNMINAKLEAEAGFSPFFFSSGLPSILFLFTISIDQTIEARKGRLKQ
jgi:hypothetical protein